MPTFSEVRVDDTANQLPYRTYYPDLEQPGFQYWQDVSALQQVVQLAGGGYVVVYGKVDVSTPNGDWNIYVQRFDASGAKVGGETLVTSQPNLQYEPVIVALADGGFAVAYTQENVGPLANGVFLRVFNSDGSYRGGDIRVDNPIGLYYTEYADFDHAGFSALEDLASPPQIITLAGGGFVVIYGKFFNDGRQWDVYARRFDDNGTPLGDDFLVSSPGVFQFEPKAVALDDGGFVIIWTVIATGVPQNNTGVFGQVYNADGSLRSGVIRIEDNTSYGYDTTYTDLDTAGFQPNEDYESPPQIVALEDGGFVITYGKWTPSLSTWTVHAQVFSASGAKIGGEIAVSTAGQWEFQPEVTALADGGFAVTWSVDVGGPIGSRVYARVYNADGTARTAEFRVDDTGTGAYETFVPDVEGGGQDTGEWATAPQIVALSNGKFVIVYSKLAGGVGDNWNLHFQVFEADGSKDGGEGVIASTGSTRHHAVVTALDNGWFTVTWQVEGAVGPNGSGLFTRMFSANDAPGARDDAFAIDEDSAISGGDLFADNGAGADSDGEADTFVITAVNGSALNVGAQIVLASGALLTVNADGTFSYNPNGAFNPAFGASDVDSFTYTIDDTFGGTSTATVTVSINGVNTLPTAQDDAFITSQNDAVIGDVLADNGAGADTDPDGHLLAVTNVIGGALGSPFTLASGAVLTVNADGTFEYDPNGAFDSLAIGQTDTESFTYTISDGFGGTDTATVTITINGVNDAPIAQDDAFVVSEDGAIIGGNVLANNGSGADSDVDSGASLAISSVNGSALNVGTQITLASGALLTVNADGTFDYDPNNAFENLSVGESDTDSFTYIVDDGVGGTDSAIVTIAINGANDAPTALNDIFALSQASGIVGGNLFAENGGGADIDADGGPFTITAINGSALNVGNSQTLVSGAVLTINANGTFDYDPTGAFAYNDTGIETFTYTIDDGFGGTSTATVTINVTLLGQSYPGTEAPDNFSGTIFGDLMTGGLRADVLSGDAGRDEIYGGAGNDTLSGGLGNDTLDGGLDSDLLNAGDGDDTLYGRSGDDTLNGDGGSDTLFGGDGADVMSGGAGDDLLDGLNHNDTLSGGDGADTIYGRQGSDSAIGDGGADTVFGGDGDDTLSGGEDNDLIDGGNNNDTLHGDGGADTLYGRQGSDNLFGDAGSDTLYGGDGDDLVNGGADADLLDGGNGIDAMNGGDGDDVLYGRNGNDVLDGGLGADTLYGGNDADTFVFSSALGGGNIDTVVFSIAEGDVIQLDVDIFTSIGLGALDANAFAVGSAATTADHRIIYDAVTGALYYDADGDGAGAAVQFATLSPGLALTAANFIGGP